MADYIERENAYSAIRSNMFDKMRTFPKRRQRLLSLLLDLISDIGHIPSADVRENVRGEWLLTLSDVYDFYKCSVCGHRIEAPGGVPHENFCPNCGADMRGENDAEKET